MPAASSSALPVNPLSSWAQRSPALARALPFILFAALTSLQGMGGEATKYWIYLIKTVLGAGMLWSLRGAITEMRWKFSWLGVTVGVVVFGLWVGLDAHYPKLGNAVAAWNPYAVFGKESSQALFFVLVRVVGSSLVVPPLEEVFYRSLICRWIERAEFLAVPLGRFSWKPFFATALLFGFSHHEWLAGILCGMLYQGLVCWTKRLGDVMTAHAVTNFLLGLWVVSRGAWHFW